MKQRTIRNSRFGGCLLAIAAVGTLFNSCKKDETSPAPASAITADTSSASLAGKTAVAVNTTPLAYMFGINTYAWDFFSSSNPTTVDQTKMGLMNTFSQ